MTMQDLSVNWEPYYRPANRLNWRGRYDGPEARRFHEVTQCIDMRKQKRLESTPHSYAVIGFCCDAGIARNQGRTGAAGGPGACRQSLSNIPVDKVQDFCLYDIGDIVCIEDQLESAQAALGHVVNWVLDHGIKPIVLGGGHETAWGNYLGFADACSSGQLGIVNLDAHFDIRPLNEAGMGNSGTPFTQIYQDRTRRGLDFNYYCFGVQPFGNSPHMFDQAKKMGVKWVSAQDIWDHWRDGLKNVLEMIDEVIESNDHIYLSMDMDVFASAFAPGVSATQPLGIHPYHALPIVDRLGASGKVISCDVVELNPEYDRDGMTAQLAGQLLAHYIHA